MVTEFFKDTKPHGTSEKTLLEIKEFLAEDSKPAINFNKNSTYAIAVTVNTFNEIQELLIKNGWKWYTGVTLEYSSDMSFIYFNRDKRLQYHTPSATVEPQVTLEQLKEYLGETTMHTLDFTSTDYYVIPASSETEFNKVQITLLELGYEWICTGKTIETFPAAVKYININKDLKMSLSTVYPTKHPIIQLNDLKRKLMKTAQFTYQDLSAMTDWKEISGPVTEKKLKGIIDKGHIIKNFRENDFVYKDSNGSWFVYDEGTEPLDSALEGCSIAPGNLMMSATSMTDVEKPALTVEYLNSDKCLIAIYSYEEALYLDSIGVKMPLFTRTKESFEDELKRYGTPVLIMKSSKWEGLDYFKDSLEPIIIVEEIKEAFSPTEGATAYKPEVWKNPKPTKKNTQPIKKDMYFLEDGKPFPQTAFVDIKDIEDKYPIHMLQPEQPLRVGDIICHNGSWSIVKNKEDKSKEYDTAWRVTDEKNKAIRVYELEEYSCGTLFDTITGKVIDKVPEGAKVASHHKDLLTFEHHEIAREFNVPFDKLKAQDEQMHKNLETILDHPLNVERKEWAYIWGPSGSGKSTLAIDYTEKTGKKYILQQGTSQLTVDDLLGYKSITTGEYFPSLLRDAVENGKVFILDEADACNGNTLLCLNALKNKTFQFPDKEITIHPDFRLVMTANTFNEYSEKYSSRNPLDKATLDRCSVIHYDMEDYHLALRYGLKYISQISLANKSPREIEREVTNLKIQEG